MKEKTSWNKKKWAEAPHVKTLDRLEELLLENRKLEDHETIQTFLHPALTDLYDPFDMKGMDDGVYRILRAIDQEERIVIFGDFDADGITSTVILVQALKDCGAEVSYRIPERNTESHGLKRSHIDELAERKVKLIITCDCGVNDQEAVAYAQEKKIDVIITDHHEPDEKRFPIDAVAVLNPKIKGCKYPEKNLSGAGIALKLAMALGSKKFQGVELIDFLEKFFEICAIGLIADCVDLAGENRIIAKFGLEKMHKTSWDGLKKLLDHCNIDPRNIDEQTVGFTIAPRLNAASRIGDVLVATQLFLGEKDMHAGRITKLDELNELRRKMTQRAYRESISQVRAGAAMQFFFREDWNPGILGLLAGRCAEELDVPVVAASIRKDGLLTASCRAPLGYRMNEALSANEKLFEHFGGHNGAAGFQAKPEKRDQIHRMLEAHFAREEREKPAIPVEATIDCKLVTLELSEFLKFVSPFGNGNKEPIFELDQVEISDFQVMGKDRNHLRLWGMCEGKQMEFTAFFADNFLNKLRIGQKLDILFTLSENIWKDERRLQMRVVDIRPA